MEHVNTNSGGVGSHNSNNNNMRPAQSTTHDQIVMLNNQGATALRLGHTHEAISKLSKALFTTNAWLKSRNNNDDNKSDQSSSSSCSYSIDSIMEHPEGSYSSSSSSHSTMELDEINDMTGNTTIDTHMDVDNVVVDDDDTSHDHNKVRLTSSSSASSSSSSTNDTKIRSTHPLHPPSITYTPSADIPYRSPIILPQEHLLGTTTNVEEFPGIFLSSTIIFNLALAYHLHATNNDNNSDQTTMFLTKAKMLYQLAIKSQEQQLYERSNSSGIFTLFFLSCVNNLGIIHRLLGDHNDAHECFSRLLTVLMLLKYCCDGDATSSRSGSSPTSSSSSQQQHPCICSSFFHNIFRTSQNNVAPAA